MRKSPPTGIMRTASEPRPSMSAPRTLTTWVSVDR